MVAQHLEHPALRHRAAGTGADHPFELAAQRLEPDDPVLDRAELAPRDGVDIGAGRQRRGVTAWVEREGVLSLGETLRLHIPVQPAWPHLQAARGAAR